MYTLSPTYVAQATELVPALTALGESDFVAVDTEFLRERTYYPKLCLVQAATENFCALFDVLSLEDSTPLWNFLAARERVKVFHAARQDLEVLDVARRAGDAGSPPALGPLFDTQIGAGFMDLPAQIGYADLVSQRLHRTLDKGQSRTDWSQRPLSAAQLRYAADDVIYLAALYRDQQRSLANTERWEWLAEETRELEDPALFTVDPTAVWQRLKGLEYLNPRQRAAIKALAEWRERRAMQKDLPRNWVLADEVMRSIAERTPQTIAELQNIQGMPPALAAKRGEEILQVIAGGVARTADEAASVLVKPTRAQLKRVTFLMDRVRSRGKQLGISPELLATRREVEKLVFANESAHLLRGWRREKIGEELVQLASQDAESANDGGNGS